MSAYNKRIRYNSPVIQQHSTVTRTMTSHTYSTTTEERVKIMIIANRRKLATVITATLYESNIDLMLSEPPSPFNSPLPVIL